MNFQLWTDVTLPLESWCRPLHAFVGVCVDVPPSAVAVFSCFPPTFVFFSAPYRRSILTFFFFPNKSEIFRDLVWENLFFRWKVVPTRSTLAGPTRDVPRPSRWPSQVDLELSELFIFPIQEGILFPELLFFPSQERKFSEILLGKTFFSPKKKEKVRKFWLCTDGSRRVPGGPPWPGLSRSCIFQLFPTLFLFLP